MRLIWSMIIIISQSEYTGACATGLSCVNGACSSASTSAPTTASPTTVSSDATTVAATTAGATTTVAATTTAENCNANSGDVCEDTTYGITKTCCSPYTCETLTDRTKACQGVNLAANQTCFEGGVVSVGPALSPVWTLFTSHCSLWEPAPPVSSVWTGCVRSPGPVLTPSSPTVSATLATSA